MKKLLLAGAAILALPASAHAALINAPLPTNTYITVGALDWAWASPCSPTGCNAGDDVLDLSFQGALGWRLPTAAEFAARPDFTAFFFKGANVPAGGTSVEGTIFFGPERSDAACAAAYFTPGFFNQCNAGDAGVGGIFGNPAWDGVANVETWLVRDHTGGGVPEPATWLTMILGMGAIGFAMRRSRQQAKVRFAF